MSITGLHLRKRSRKRLVHLLDRIISLLEGPEAKAEARPAEPAPEASPKPPETKPQPVEPAPEPKLPPLPGLPRALEAPPDPGLNGSTSRAKVDDVIRRSKSTTKVPAEEPTAAETTPKHAPTAAPSTPAGRKPKESPEDRQERHWKRTREGVLRFVHDNGGKASLRALHDYSESTFFVAHVSFSRLMEELTADELLDYDHDTAEATLTEAGRAEIL